MKNKVLIVLVVLAVIAFEYWDNNGGSLPDNNSQNQQGGNSVHRAFAQRLTDVQLQGVGVVKKVLADDLDGSRHQRFILDVGQQLSILVAHNIDLADKIKPLQRGDTVEFYGEPVVHLGKVD